MLLVNLLNFTINYSVSHDILLNSEQKSLILRNVLFLLKTLQKNFVIMLCSRFAEHFQTLLKMQELYKITGLFINETIRNYF